MSALSERSALRLLEKLPAGAYTCDAAGLITWFNDHASQLWGRSPRLNDPVDRYCGSFKLFAPEGTPIDHDQCWMALALKHQQEFNGRKIVIERPDGQRRTVLAHANPVHDASGRLLGAVNVLVDITEQQRMEDALKETDRARNRFLATLAHELRNPLAPLRNAAELLRMEMPGAPHLQWGVEVIDRQVEQMTRLIDDLLDAARVTHDRLRIRREHLDLAEVLQAAVETSRPLIEARSQELSLEVPSEPLCVEGDRTRLAQVTANLLNNASRYTGRGGRIWLEAERQGSDALLRVRDTGIGIPGELLPRVFDLFMQGTPTPRPEGGLGLGLTLAKQLVELHGGRITVHSDGPGQGSEFSVRLPAVVKAPLKPVPVSEPTRSGVPLRIVVVDDSREVVDSLSVLLQAMGHEVASGSDGLQAVALADTFRPDVVLLDIGLPHMDGHEVARRIRNQPWGEGMLLIAVTGWGQEADRERSREAGCDHHLVKPIDPAGLAVLLASAPSTPHADRR